MILLDTNVLSALMRKTDEPAVERWLDRQPSESVWTTAITVFEIRFGLELLPPSRRRTLLETAFATAIGEILEGRVLPFDGSAAQVAGAIAAEQRRAGRSIEFRDVQIAGIATARKATLATRNVKHFEGTGLVVVDPWSN